MLVLHSLLPKTFPVVHRHGVCLSKKLGEPFDVDSHVLLVQVDLLHLHPPFAGDDARVQQHRTLPVIHLGQRALLRCYVVGHVLQAKPPGGPSVELLRRLLQPQRHDLNEDGGRAHEEEVRHGGAVDGQHHVRGRQRAVDHVQRRGALWLDELHVEPDPLARPHHLPQVQQHSAALAHEDGDPRTVVAAAAAAVLLAVVVPRRSQQWAQKRRRLRRHCPGLDDAAVSFTEESLEVLNAITCHRH